MASTSQSPPIKTTLEASLIRQRKSMAMGNPYPGGNPSIPSPTPPGVQTPTPTFKGE